MSVDALAARREARRRKILENSTNRLTRILGQSDTSINSDDSPVDASSASTVKNVLSEPCNGAAFHEVPNSFPSIPNGVLNEHAYDANETSNFFSEEVRSGTGIGAQGSVSQEHSNGSDSRVTWIIFSILLGLIVRLMFEFNLGVLFADSLCMPFITMMLAKYMSNPDNFGEEHGASGQGLVRLALIMSGVPQTALDKIFRCQSIISIIVFDFSLYFFSFTVANELLSIFVSR